MSTDAILSPMQQDYVNKEEFYTLDSYVRDGFEGLGKQIDFVEKNLGDKIDTVRFKSYKY